MNTKHLGRHETISAGLGRRHNRWRLHQVEYDYERGFAGI